jgi:hypothetical protein
MSIEGVDGGSGASMHFEAESRLTRVLPGAKKYDQDALEGAALGDGEVDSVCWRRNGAFAV